MLQSIDNLTQFPDNIFQNSTSMAKAPFLKLNLRSKLRHSINQMGKVNNDKDCRKTCNTFLSTTMRSQNSFVDANLCSIMQMKDATVKHALCSPEKQKVKRIPKPVGFEAFTHLKPLNHLQHPPPISQFTQNLDNPQYTMI